MTVERDIELLQKQITMLVKDVQAMKLLISNLQQATIVALEDGPRHSAQDLRDNWLAAERRADAEEKASFESGGILSDVCDIAFEDEMRAATHGYDDIRDQVRGLVRIYQRWLRVTDGCKACESTGAGVMFQFRCGPGVNKVPGHPCLECDGMGRVPKPADPEPEHHDDCGTKHRGCAPECKFQGWHRAREPWQERWERLREQLTADGAVSVVLVMKSIENDT